MNHRLGIIDWGIGGISIYKLVRERMDVPVTYFSDTGVTPYGKMNRRDLAARLTRVSAFLGTCRVTHVVIGCNAASTVIPSLASGRPVTGMIESAVKSAASSKPTKLGLIGGRRTVLSGTYRRAFEALDIELVQRVAQPLSGMIESGDLSSARLHDQARRILTPLRHCSHILLACTHYPAIISVLAEYVPQSTKFIDPAKNLVNGLEKLKLYGDGTDEFFTSGEAASMRNAAKVVFGVSLRSVKVYKQ